MAPWERRNRNHAALVDSLVKAEEKLAQAVGAERAACLAIVRAERQYRNAPGPETAARIEQQIERRGEVARPEAPGVLAERARCAQVAREWRAGQEGWISGLCEEIAQAIERGEG